MNVVNALVVTILAYTLPDYDMLAQERGNGALNCVCVQVQNVGYLTVGRDKRIDFVAL
jgi:hypothetical protein